MSATKFDLSGFANKIKAAKGVKSKVMRQALPIFVRNTPIRTGNARRNTTLKGDVIHADYGYATQLDEGSSRQAPKGMSEPTLKELKKLVKAAITSRR